MNGCPAPALGSHRLRAHSQAAPLVDSTPSRHPTHALLCTPTAHHAASACSGLHGHVPHVLGHAHKLHHLVDEAGAVQQQQRHAAHVRRLAAACGARLRPGTPLAEDGLRILRGAHVSELRLGDVPAGVQRLRRLLRLPPRRVAQQQALAPDGGARVQAHAVIRLGPVSHHPGQQAVLARQRPGVEPAGCQGRRAILQGPGCGRACLGPAQHPQRQQRGVQARRVCRARLRQHRGALLSYHGAHAGRGAHAARVVHAHALDGNASADLGAGLVLQHPLQADEHGAVGLVGRHKHGLVHDVVVVLVRHRHALHDVLKGLHIGFTDEQVRTRHHPWCHDWLQRLDDILKCCIVPRQHRLRLGPCLSCAKQ
mmetsp:Transcript_30674/g.78357  ORF Transcript_30674/g.78357 Transcript_30674/m.78357 type:complete len:368 (+) Transcript_30674:727-1830(+)